MKLAIPILLLAGCSGPEPAAPARPSSFLDADALEALPHVHAVEVSPASDKPKRQIIHILNWHYVPFSDFEADIRAAEGELASSPQEQLLENPHPSTIPIFDQTSEKWESFLADVEAVQVEQMALLRELAKFHGLKQVFLEGVTKVELPAVRKFLDALVQWEKPEGDGILDGLWVDLHRQDTLEAGAAGRLMMAGELEVLAAEEVDGLLPVYPFRIDEVRFDNTANERREDAIVRNVLASESPVAVLILGGGHDLSDNVERIGGGQVEYVRVQVDAHKKAVGE